MRDERKQTLDARIYPVVSIGTKPSLVHVVEVLTKSIASRSPNLFRNTPWLATKATPLKLTPSFRSPRCRFPLRSFSAEDGGPAPHQAEESKTCRWVTKTPSGWHTEIQQVIHSRNSIQGSTPCSHTLCRANPSTNTLKSCAKPKDVINELLSGFKTFFRVLVVSHELQHLKWPGWDLI
jgi:hypothetical protein